MPRAHYLSAGFFTAAGAGNAAATSAPGDSFNVPNFINGNGYLETFWANAATTDWVSIKSPRMHDNNQGMRMQTLSNTGDPLLPWGGDQGLYSGDTPTVTIDQTGAGSGAVATIYSFDDMPGVQPRLDSWADVEPRIVNISGVDVALGACGAIGSYSAGVAINSSFDNFQADSDYALLGYLTASNVLAVAVVGQDTGNLKVGGPGAADPKITRDWFIKMSTETGRNSIPIIAANNKGGTLVSQVDSTAHAAQHVTLILAQLRLSDMGFEIEVSISDTQVLDITPAVASQTLIGGGARLVGWSLRETTGAAPAVVHFTSGGSIIATSGMGNGLSDTHFLGAAGIPAAGDITVVVVSGAIEGVAYVALML